MKISKLHTNERSLFVCHTPLQAKIAMRIIQEKKIGDYDVFYFTHTINDTQISHYELLAKNANHATFWPCKVRFPKFFGEMKKMFNDRIYGSIYLSSIDSIYCHLVLTYSSFYHLYTYDDGNANIVYNSLYYECEKPFYTNFIYWLFGSRYTMEKLKLQSSLHYSIYKDKKNIIDNVEYVSLFDQNVLLNRDVQSGTECNVFLGSYFSYVVKADIESFANRLLAYFTDMTNLFYIQHPMEKSNYFSGIKSLKGKGVLAEELILELTKRYETVNVYGIASSAQFNLAGVEYIKSYTLVSQSLTDNCNIVSQLLIENGSLPFYID